MNKRKVILAMIIGGGLLASCSGDDSPTVSSVALYQINTSTCATNTPIDINSVNFSENDETQTDVSNLNPNCAPPSSSPIKL